ncbi:MAG TPA: hypothetical protein VHO29_03320 [Marmoricola sp.]|nr:hypothetical protein [Marmoricola sp.]
MRLSSRLAAVPALTLAFAGLSMTTAHASTDPLSTDAVNALTVASCQLDPTVPLTLDEMAPVVVAETDVTVVPGEVTAHLVRADVTTSAGDVQECTFGVLHRDVLLRQVQYEGTATLALGDGAGGTVASAVTDLDLGNMGRGRVDPTTEVPLEGFLVPTASVVEDPTYTFSVDRKALETVQIAAGRPVTQAADHLLAAQVKAAATQERKQVKAAKKTKHSAKAVAAAQRRYAARVATAQAAYHRATAPTSVVRPVSHQVTVTGTVSIG